MSVLHSIILYWWILIPIVLLSLYKIILRVLFGMVIIPEDKIGLVIKKFVLFGPNKTLPQGRIIAMEGEAGMQVDPLAPGIYWGYWIWQYTINFENFTEIPIGKIGLIEAADGEPLPMGAMLAKSVESNNYQDGKAFLTNKGQKGKQRRYITAGKYRINTMLFTIEQRDVTMIPNGKVGIITSLDGQQLDAGPIPICSIEKVSYKEYLDWKKSIEGKYDSVTQANIEREAEAKKRLEEEGY